MVASEAVVVEAFVAADVINHAVVEEHRRLPQNTAWRVRGT